MIRKKNKDENTEKKMTNLYDDFSKQVDYNTKHRKIKSSMFASKKAGFVVTVCLLADFFMVFGPLDKAFTQNIVVTSILALVAVFGLDLSPSMMSSMISRGEFKLSKFISLLIAFGLSLFAVTYLRRANIYNDFAKVGNLNLQSVTGTDIIISILQQAASIVAMAMPVITSIVAYNLNYDKDYFDRQVDHLKSQRIGMEDYLDTFYINRESSAGLEDILDQRYKDAVDDMVSYRETMLDYCKNRLALACDDPDTTSRLLEQLGKDIDDLGEKYKNDEFIKVA